MSTRETLIAEIQKQPEGVLRELTHYLAFLVEQREKEATGAPSTNGGWPTGYFANTAGAFAGEPFERAPQLPLEQRKDW